MLGLALARRGAARRALAGCAAGLARRGAAGSAASGSGGKDHLGTYDGNFADSVPKSGDVAKREFTYLALGAGRFIYASAVRLAVIKFVASWSASADVLALASLEVELDKVPLGQSTVVKWRGKPVFVRHRTPEEIKAAESADLSTMRDPQTDAQRVVNPEWLITLGVCTHLGCVPLANSGEYNGWFCPCHGSHYDTSGRIRKGPAPLNLEVPPYKFIPGGESGKVLIG